MVNSKKNNRMNNFIYKDVGTQTHIMPEILLEKEIFFSGIQDDWYETFTVINQITNRTNINFKCLFNGCGMVFKKSCNLKSHFRKHNGHKPFVCQICLMFFSHAANLASHLNFVHKLDEEQTQIYKKNSLLQAKLLGRLPFEDQQKL